MLSPAAIVLLLPCASMFSPFPIELIQGKEGFLWLCVFLRTKKKKDGALRMIRFLSDILQRKVYDVVRVDYYYFLKTFLKVSSM